MAIMVSMQKMLQQILTVLLVLTLAHCSSFKSVFVGEGPAKKTSRPKTSKTTYAKVNHSKKAPKVKKTKVMKNVFHWPHHATVTSEFGERWGRMHQGIDIKAATGTRVRASAAGKVIYADELGGYGKLIVIQHKNNYFTAYGHNSKLVVKENKKVKQGQTVALSGNTGHSTGPHIHFEIRKGHTPVNPLPYLP